MKQFLIQTGRIIKKSLPFITGCGIFAAATAVFATSDITITSIASNMQTTVSETANILTNVSLVTGIGLTMASFFKLKQHKDQPTQVPISNGVTLLVLGAGLTVFPLLLPTANKAAFGSVTTGTVGGGDMVDLIGAG